VRWFKEDGEVEMTKTPLLTFQTGDGEFKKVEYAHDKDNTYLDYKIHESDDLALKTKQDPDKATTFSTQAGDVGAFIFAKVWEAYNGDSVPNSFDFATSHGGVLESFLYKVIKMKEGEEEAEEIIAEIGGTGFDYNDGFEVEGKIYDKNDVEAWNIEVAYKDKLYKLSSGDLVQIIEEGEEFKKRMRENLKKE